MLRETTRKLKFDRLVQLFDRIYPGHGFSWAFTVERVWHITAENAPDGAIGRALTDEEIEAGVRWPGEPGQYVAQLVEARWLDRVEGGTRLYVHDWHDHADRSVHMRLAREGRLFANGSMPTLSHLKEGDREAARRRYESSTHVARMQHMKPSGQGQDLGQKEEEEIQEAAAPPSRSPLVNLLKGGDPPAERDEAEAWWAAEGERIEAEAASKLPDDHTPRQLGKKVKATALGWWKTYLRGPREHRGAAERRRRFEEAEATIQRIQARGPPERTAPLFPITAERI